LYQANSGGDQEKPCLRRLRYSEQVRNAQQVQRDYTVNRHKIIYSYEEIFFYAGIAEQQNW
ncbi:hypothetical protein SHV42_07235, partial [Pseudomonas capeferrum]